MGGIAFMLLGTIIAYFFILPRIYRCPGGASCGIYLDLDGNAIPLLHSLMQYWLQIGASIAEYGLVRLISYQAWFVSIRKGTTIGDLDRGIGAIKGSVSDAARLVLRRQNMWLGIFAIIQLVTGFAISIVIASSMRDLKAYVTVDMDYHYPTNFLLPVAYANYNDSDSIDQLFRVTTQLEQQLFNPIEEPSNLAGGFEGTLVLRDNRTVFAQDPRPSGFRITGSLSCSPLEEQGLISSTLANSDYFINFEQDVDQATAYNISYGGTWFIAFSNFVLSSSLLGSELSGSGINSQYLWASNTSNLVPNATSTTDGVIYYALCNHTTSMTDVTPSEGPDIQYINPSQPLIGAAPNDENIRQCPSNDINVCVAFSVNDLFASWCKIQTTPYRKYLVPMSSLNNVLRPYGSAGPNTSYQLDSDAWAATVAIMLDAIVATSKTSRSEYSVQHLRSTTQSVGRDYWWLQTIIPGIIFILLISCAGYILFYDRKVPQEGVELRPLTILTVLREWARNASLRRLAQRGELEESSTFRWSMPSSRPPPRVASPRE